MCVSLILASLWSMHRGTKKTQNEDTNPSNKKGERCIMYPVNTCATCSTIAGGEVLEGSMYQVFHSVSAATAAAATATASTA